MPNQQIFSVPVPNPGRSAFNLSHEYKTSTEMGRLEPVLARLTMPGTVYSLDATTIVRLMPLVAPVLHNFEVRVDAFFCPLRNLWDNPASATDNWEEFITGGEDGTSTPTFPSWDGPSRGTNTLWDKLGYPTTATADRDPTALEARAYCWTWNQWYRNQEVDSELTIDLTGGSDVTDYGIQYRRWPHDYFTSALLAQQRGTAPALPVTITGDGGDITVYNANDATVRTWETYNAGSASDRTGLATQPSANGSARWSDPGLQATNVNIAQLRLATAQQGFLEKMNLFGSRYTEYLRGHWGLAPPDGTLQRPVHVGTISSPLQISEIVQTSETNTTPQGTLVGHGINMDSNHVGRFRASEWGIFLVLASIMPEGHYSSQGLDRLSFGESLTRYDFYAPEFSQLSDQAIEEVELRATSTGSHNTTIFGYIGAWDHYRVANSKVTGYFRPGSSPDFSHWHLGRDLSGSRPALNTAFVEMGGSYAKDPTMKRIFVTEDEYSFMLQVGLNLRAIQPMPQYARPGGLS